MGQSWRTMLLAATAVAALSGWASTASAADPQGANVGATQRTFNIPPQSLSSALIAFGEQSRLQFTIASDIATGKTTAGLSGHYTVQQGLQRLLAGSGLTWRFSAANTVIIEAPIPGVRTLGAVEVEGTQTDSFAALNGFGRGTGSNGSSDPTATEGTGSLTTNGASVASKAPEALKDTPQSVTVITAERIHEQNLTDLTSALNYAPGVTLEQETGITTFFYSRGFQITAFQIDGGAPLDLGANGAYRTTPNLAEYDNVQVLRGSDALFGGAAQPGGVVSLDRKRPLEHNQLIVDLNGGSWDNYQAQVDATGPIGFDGHLRARLVASDQDRNFYYHASHQNKAFVYGVLEGDLGPDTLVRAGVSYEHQLDTKWNTYGLPTYSDGSDLGLSRSTNLSPLWNRFDISTTEVFAALEHRFNADWGLKVNFTRLAQDSPENVGQNYGFIYRDDPSLSNFGENQASRLNYTSVQYAADAALNGEFQWLGHEQAVTIGADYAVSNSSQSNYSESVNIPIDVFAFNPASLNPEPQHLLLKSEIPEEKQEQWGGYIKLNIQPIDKFHLIGGVRLSSYWYIENEVFFHHSPPTPSFTSSSTNDQSGVLTPYGAATYALTPEVTAYASYADIFQPQGNVLDLTGKALPPVTGATYEAGIKGALRGGKLNASLAIYYTDESNQAVAYAGNCLVPSGCYLNSGTVISQGVDLELSGELLPGWQFQGGYTLNVNRQNQAFLDAGYGNGLNSTYTTQQPEHQVKLWTAYTPTGGFSAWTVGGGLRMESARSTVGSVCSVELDPTTGNCSTNVYVPFAFTQGLYTVIDLRAAYKINSHWQAALDLTNIGDTHYYATAAATGTSFGRNFYGEPRAFMFSIRAKY